MVPRAENGLPIGELESAAVQVLGIIKLGLLPESQPIVLLTDYPTIGGYPKIANVISADYHLLVQKIPGEKFKFRNVELNEAEQLYKEHLNNISQIIKNIKETN